MDEGYLSLHTDYLNDPEVHRYIFSRPPFTFAQQQAWLQERKRSGDKVFAILAPESSREAASSEFIGVIELRDIDFKKGSAYTASMLGNRKYSGKGIAHEARLMVLRYAFNDLGLKRVYSKTIRSNLRSRQSLERTGYRCMGVFPKIRELNGTLHDELLYGISRQSWFEHWQKYEAGEASKIL